MSFAARWSVDAHPEYRNACSPRDARESKREFLAGLQDLFRSFDLGICAPLFAKRSWRNRSRIAPGRPCSYRRRELSDQSADLSDSTLPHRGSLKQTSDSRAPLIQSSPRPREGIETKREMLRELSFDRPLLIDRSTRASFHNFRAQMQKQRGNIDLDRADFAARATQTRGIRQLRGFA